jgi:predicted transcriptional regulator
MASEILHLTAQIVMSHASMTTLTPKELVAEIKVIHALLVSLDQAMAVKVPEPRPVVRRQRQSRKGKITMSDAAKAVQNEAGLPVGDADYMEFMESREG